MRPSACAPTAAPPLTPANAHGTRVHACSNHTRTTATFISNISINAMHARQSIENALISSAQFWVHAISRVTTARARTHAPRFPPKPHTTFITYNRPDNAYSHTRYVLLGVSPPDTRTSRSHCERSLAGWHCLPPLHATMGWWRWCPRCRRRTQETRFSPSPCHRSLSICA